MMTDLSKKLKVSITKAISSGRIKPCDHAAQQILEYEEKCRLEKRRDKKLVAERKKSARK